MDFFIFQIFSIFNQWAKLVIIVIMPPLTQHSILALLWSVECKGNTSTLKSWNVHMPKTLHWFSLSFFTIHWPYFVIECVMCKYHFYSNSSIPRCCKNPSPFKKCSWTSLKHQAIGPSKVLVKTSSQYF